MPLIRSIVNWGTIKRMNDIELFRKYPADIQWETLQKLIDRSVSTEWGKAHSYDSIKSVEDFQNQVPLQHYEDIKPYVDRLREGERDLFWPGEIKWFAKSSGTTSDKSKFIPVSKDALEECHFQGGKDVMYFYHHNNPNTRLLKGKGLIIGGSHQINNFNNESYFGDLSAILLENMPFYASLLRTPKASIALLDNWEEKLEKMANATIKENVTSISGVPSWTMVLINRILEITGKKHITDVWPNLELFIHGGVSFTPYRNQFERLIPNEDMNYMETYNASEGFFALQDDPTDSSMMFLLDLGIFYEFIPATEVYNENPTVLTIEDVELNKNYAVVISTNSGLWRYIIGDTVTFNQKFPHKFKITGRTKHFINAFGEELIIDNAEKALKIACIKTGSEVLEYTAAPIYMDEDTKGAHEWLIEFGTAPGDLSYFTYIFDQALKTVNSDYESKRFNDYTLAMPKVHSVKNGVFHNWLESKGKLGGQHKVPRLSNNRLIIDEILQIM